MIRPAVIVHGGAGGWERANAGAATAGCIRAAQEGADILRAGGGALDAAEAACCALEDEPLYDAGIGSFLNSAGDVELDAIFVDGGSPDELANYGAVAGVRRLQNPIRLARRILEERYERFLIGSSADALAAQLGLPMIENAALITEANRALYEARRAADLAGGAGSSSHGGTVGVVTRDVRGRLAAATSTGGSLHKPSGRVGDSPLFGAGAYASASHGAASATGAGERIMRALLTQDAVARLAAGGMTAQSACEAALVRVLGFFPEAGVGLILVDGEGRIGTAHSTAAMPRAWWSGGEIHAAFAREEV